MDVKDLVPPGGTMQRIHCPQCGHHRDLRFVDFKEDVSGIPMWIQNIPVLRCPACGDESIADLARFTIRETHARAKTDGLSEYNAVRRKRELNHSFTSVEFLYDADDHFYLPGLFRPHDVGFLTPVFFNRAVLLKYDNAPGYRVRFASTTYGTIHTEDEYISFGINRHGRVVMWLGDIGKLPVSEQHYLRSENVLSDHSIGSEFYDGQIDVVFTPRSKEDELFRQRSNFIEACLQRFGEKLAHLDAEVMELALSFNPPVVDTPKERRHVADTLNKIYLESLDNGALAKALTAQGGDPKSLGSLKRLQGVLEKALPGEDVARTLSPLYVLYDLRVAYSHLHSTERAEDTLQKVTDRLGLARDVGLMAIYAALVGQLTESFASLAPLVDPEGIYDRSPPME